METYEDSGATGGPSRGDSKDSGAVERGRRVARAAEERAEDRNKRKELIVVQVNSRLHPNITFLPLPWL